MNVIHIINHSYQDASFIIQLRAKTLTYFLLICSGLIAAFFIAQNVIAQRSLLSLINVVMIVIFVFLVSGIVLLYSGKYFIAANVSVIGSVIALGLLVNFGSMAYNEGIILTNYQFLVLIVFSALFCSRNMVIVVAILSLIFSFLSLIRTDLLTDKVKTVTIIDFTFELIIITAISYMLLRLMEVTIAKLQEELENKDQLMRIKKLLEAVKDISLKLAESSGKMTETSKKFSKNAQDQAAIAEEITATIEEISAGVENVANNADYQYNGIVQFADQTSKLSELISKMEDKINNALQRTLGIKEHAKSGARQLDEMNNSMGTISQSSGEMTGIMNIIKEISDQINLLSLNAAIEAARAGDAGRGFAVVADEISKLADRTSLSVKEIEILINTNEREIQKGKGNVDQTVATMSGIIQGVDDINTMVGLLAEFMQQQSQVNAQVMSTSNEVKKRAEEIRNASEEQKNASAEIVKSISVINELTQANASGALVLAESSEEILAMSEIMEKQVSAIDVV